MISAAFPRKFLKGGVLTALGVALASCSGGGSGGSHVSASAKTDPIAYFGTGFAADFQAPANSTPAAPKADDNIPVSLTANPQALTF